MAIRYDHAQYPKTAYQILAASATDSVITTGALAAQVIYRAYINPGFNATLEWLQYALAFTLATDHSLMGALGTAYHEMLAAEWQIRCRGAAAFVKIADVSSSYGMGVADDPGGTASSGGAGFLTDTGKTWGNFELKGATLVITAGLGAGQSLVITNNSADTLYFTTAVTTDATTVYYVHTSSKVFFAKGVYAAAATTDTAPFEIQLVATIAAAPNLTWSFGTVTMQVRAVGESV